MILEKRLMLFVFLLYFPCSLCDDNASQEATNSIPHKKWNSGSTEKQKSNIYYDFASADNSTSFANDSEFADSSGTSVNYNFESTENPTSYYASDRNSIFILRTHPTNLSTDPGSTENPTTIVNDFESTDSLGNNVSYNFESVGDLTSYASNDPRSTKHPTSLTTTKPESVENPTRHFTSLTTTKPESVENPTRHSTSLTTTKPESVENPTSFISNSGLRTNTSYDIYDISSSNITQNTQSNLATVIDSINRIISFTDNTISTTINSTLCDSAANASDAKEVINLKAENKSTEWIILSWDSPCDNVTNIKYLIERCEDGNCNLTNETDTYHNATDLDPCTEYKFIVKIIIKDWKSNGVSLTETTDNTIFEIGDVVDLNVRNISVKTIQLAWQAPVVNAKCISNYSIKQCDESSCNETTVVATNYTANDLNPCMEYHFTVKTVTLTAQSAGLNEIAKTASPKLSKPESIHITPGNFSLNVTWEPPKSDTNCIEYYHVSLPRVDPPRTFNPVNRSLQIKHLHACATYEVHIAAVNKDDVHGETAIKSGITNRSETKPPRALPLPPSHANNITIIWSIEKDNNDCQLSAIFTECNHTGQTEEGCDPVNNLSSTNVDEENVNKPSFTMNTTVSNLSAYTNYTCWGYIVSIGDLHSNWSEEVSTTTSEAAPSPPTFTIKEINNFNFNLTWEFSKCIPGVLEQCDIVIDMEPRYLIPEWCADEPKSTSVNCSVNTLTYDFQDLKPFTIYKVRMRAKTKAVEWSDYNEQNFSTKSTVPGAITKFNSSFIIIKETSKDPNVLETILTWGMPCSLNGEFEYFYISIYGTKDGFEPHSFFKIEKCLNYVRNNHMCTTVLKENEFDHLKGEFNYTFTISTKVKNIESRGNETSQSIQYPPGIPPQPDERDINMIITGSTVRSYKTTTTAVVFLPLFPNDNGDIKYYAIMVSKKGHNEQSSKRFDLKKYNWPNATSWKEAMMKEFTITYQATRLKWNPYEDNLVVDYDGIKVIKYEIGAGGDSNCKEFSYCNGPLKPDTSYDVRIRAFTYGGYIDSDVLFSIKTNAELNIVSVIAAVFSILLMGILVTMMLLVRKCSPYILLRRLLHSDMPGSPVPAPFTRKKFINHCQELVDNPGKLSNEFRLLQTLSVDLQMPTNTACLQANRKKNRYSDILPYDFSRVKLEVIDNDPNTDYINASFIKGYSGEDEYIACQGPKEETTYDFWRMVDQYNINIIVMLTQLVEKGKEKCHQYYPAIRETFRYENMTIRCTSELDFRTHTQRTLILQKENKKSITHLHFKDWPDHDVPEDFDAMINFCQIMRRNISANKDFIVVHCSAGIGRTGTLIAIDILLQHLRDDRKLDVFGTVYRLRHNRINMVQRESQYAYIYNCIKQVLKNPYFLKTYKPPPVSPVYQNISKKAKEATNSDNNLVNNLELLKKYNNSISLESLESIYNFFPWSTARNTINSGLRHYKSMGALNVKTHHVALGRSRTLDRVFYKSQKDSSYEISIEGLQESFPLLTCSKSAGVLGDSMQYATDKTCEKDD